MPQVLRHFFLCNAREDEVDIGSTAVGLLQNNPWLDAWLAELAARSSSLTEKPVAITL